MAARYASLAAVLLYAGVAMACDPPPILGPLAELGQPKDFTLEDQARAAGVIAYGRVLNMTGDPRGWGEEDVNVTFEARSYLKNCGPSIIHVTGWSRYQFCGEAMVRYLLNRSVILFLCGACGDTPCEGGRGHFKIVRGWALGATTYGPGTYEGPAPLAGWALDNDFPPLAPCDQPSSYGQCTEVQRPPVHGLSVEQVWAIVGTAIGVLALMAGWVVGSIILEYRRNAMKNAEGVINDSENEVGYNSENESKDEVLYIEAN